MTLPFNIKSITVENTGFNSDGDEVKILEIDENLCTIDEDIEGCVDSGMGYTMYVVLTEFPWSFTRKDVTANPYVLIQLQ